MHTAIYKDQLFKMVEILNSFKFGFEGVDIHVWETFPENVQFFFSKDDVGLGCKDNLTFLVTNSV